MGFKLKTFLISWGLSAVIYVLMFLMFSGDNHFLERFLPEGGMRILLCIAFGIILGFITSLCIFLFSKSVKAQNAIMTEFEENGYSDKHLNLLQNEVSRLSSKPVNQVALNYIIILADLYSLRMNVQAASNTISMVNPVKNAKLFNPGTPVGKSNLLKFYNVQLSICEHTGDVAKANALVNEAMPTINSCIGKNDIQDSMIAEILSICNILNGRYDEALRNVELCQKHDKDRAKVLYNVMKGRIYYYMNDANAVRYHYEEAAKYIQKKYEYDVLAFFRQAYMR